VAGPIGIRHVSEEVIVALSLALAPCARGEAGELVALGIWVARRTAAFSLGGITLSRLLPYIPHQFDKLSVCHVSLCCFVRDGIGDLKFDPRMELRCGRTRTPSWLSSWASINKSHLLANFDSLADGRG